MRKKTDILIGSMWFISLIVAIKLSSLPTIQFIPEFILRYFITSEEIRTEYALLYDIAIAILISGLFYFMVDSIPEKIKEDRAKRVIGKYVGEVESAMLHILSTVLFVYDISESIDALGQKNFLVLDSDTKQSEREIAYHITRHENRKNIKVMSYGTLNSVVRNGINTILHYIENIRQYEYLYSNNVGFMECIRSIELCSFVTYFNEKKGYQCFLFEGSSNMIKEFLDLYRELKSYKMSSFYMDIDFCSEEETESYRKERLNLTGLEMVSKRRAEYEKIANENKTVLIIYNDHIPHNSIATYLKNHLQMDCVFPDERRETEDVSKYKIVVILATRITKELIYKVKNYREKQNFQGKILIIYEYKEFSNLWLKRNNGMPIEFYWLKSSIRCPILNVYFWRDEPTKETINLLINTIRKMQGSDVLMLV